MIIAIIVFLLSASLEVLVLMLFALLPVVIMHVVVLILVVVLMAGVHAGVGEAIVSNCVDGSDTLWCRCG